MIHPKFYLAAMVLAGRHVAAQFTSTNTLPDIALAARVLVGDATCPYMAPGDINVHVFAAVHLHETTHVTVESDTTVLFVTSTTETQVKIDADVSVCLCLDASVSTNLVSVPTRIQLAAEADIEAYLHAHAAADASLSLLGLANANARTNIDVELSVGGTTPCNCPNTFIPGCSNGQCSCTPCPNGLYYRPNLGICGPLPSSIPRRSLASERVGRDTIAARQAKRSDVVRRFLSPKGSGLVV